MKLTAFTTHALRLLMYIAAEPCRRVTVREVARALDVPENHLAKVAHLLGKRGWIETVRGKGGGLQLAKPPQDIVIGAVIRDTEGAPMMAECFAADGGHCVISRCCAIRRAFVEAAAAFYSVLDHCALADISDSCEAHVDDLA